MKIYIPAVSSSTRKEKRTIETIVLDYYFFLYFRAWLDISLFKLLLEHKQISEVDTLLHNTGSNWLNKPLRNHINYKIDHFFWLETQKSALRLQNDWYTNPGDTLKKVEKEQEVIYSNLKKCKNLAKYYTKSCNKMKTIQDLALLDKLDYNNIEAVEHRLNMWHKIESDKIRGLVKNYPLSVSENQKKTLTKKAEDLWKYLRTHGVYSRKKQSSNTTSFDNVY